VCVSTDSVNMELHDMNNVLVDVRLSFDIVVFNHVNMLILHDLHIFLERLLSMHLQSVTALIHLDLDVTMRTSLINNISNMYEQDVISCSQ
jgi:hypothetical protein